MNLLPISSRQYFGRYEGHPHATPRVCANVFALLDLVNAALLLARQDGVLLRCNPVTRCAIAGTGNGGFRPDDCKVGAEFSWHRRWGRLAAELRREGEEPGPGALDVFDPARELAAWSIHNRARLEAIGIVGMEDPRWTPTWVHWQIFRVPSGRWCYIPSSAAPLAAAVPGQVVA